MTAGTERCSQCMLPIVRNRAWPKQSRLASECHPNELIVAPSSNHKELSRRHH